MVSAIAQLKIFGTVSLVFGTSLFISPPLFLHGPLATLASFLFSQPTADLGQADATALSLINIGILYWLAALCDDEKFAVCTVPARLLLSALKLGVVLIGRGSGALCCMCIADGVSALCLLYTTGVRSLVPWRVPLPEATTNETLTTEEKGEGPSSGSGGHFGVNSVDLCTYKTN